MIYGCNECGICKAVCPMYKAMLKETQSPRGFIKLENKNAKHVTVLNCSNCKACEEICPSKVEFDIEKIRQKTIYEIQTEAAKKILQNIKELNNPYGIDETK